jgi:hypothetical protein
MDTKLTLKMDVDVIRKAKTYAEQRGVSLSRLVEGYFLGLIAAGRSPEEPQGVVAELAGLLRGKEGEIGDYREEYADFLTKKYS